MFAKKMPMYTSTITSDTEFTDEMVFDPLCSLQSGGRNLMEIFGESLRKALELAIVIKSRQFDGNARSLIIVDNRLLALDLVFPLVPDPAGRVFLRHADCLSGDKPVLKWMGTFLPRTVCTIFSIFSHLLSLARFLTVWMGYGFFSMAYTNTFLFVIFAAS